MGATKSENHKFQPAYGDDSLLPFSVSVTFIYPFSYFNSIRRRRRFSLNLRHLCSKRWQIYLFVLHSQRDKDCERVQWGAGWLKMRYKSRQRIHFDESKSRGIYFPRRMSLRQRNKMALACLRAWIIPNPCILLQQKQCIKRVYLGPEHGRLGRDIPADIPE